MSIAIRASFLSRITERKLLLKFQIYRRKLALQPRAHFHLFLKFTPARFLIVYRVLRCMNVCAQLDVLVVSFLCRSCRSLETKVLTCFRACYCMSAPRFGPSQYNKSPPSVDLASSPNQHSDRHPITLCDFRCRTCEVLEELGIEMDPHIKSPPISLCQGPVMVMMNVQRSKTLLCILGA